MKIDKYNNDIKSLLNAVLALKNENECWKFLRDLLTEAEIKNPTVVLNNAFKKGLHTISGSIEAPNACSLVSASATVVENASGTQSILVAISLQKDEGICLQVPTRINFKTTISAPANLPITATVNGFPADITSS